MPRDNYFAIILHNKKVLLRERKRHTARRVVSARYVGRGGGYPIQSWWGGTPSSHGGGGTPSSYGGGVPHPVMVGGIPSPQVPPPES